MKSPRTALHAPPLPAPPWPPPRLASGRSPQGEHDRAARDVRRVVGEPASFGRRLVAALVDGAIVTLGLAVLVSPVGYYWWVRDLRSEVQFLPILTSLVIAGVAFVLGGFYYVYFWGVKGSTPGQQLLDLAVEGEDGTFPVGPSKAFVRLLGYVLSGVFLGIGFLMIAIDGLGLHDRMAGTRVVRRGGI